MGESLSMFHGFQRILCAKFDSNRRRRGTGDGSDMRSGPRCALNGVMDVNNHLSCCI